MKKRFFRTVSAALAATIALACFSVCAPLKAAAVGANDHPVSQDSFNYIGSVGNLSPETVSSLAWLFYTEIKKGSTSIDPLPAFRDSYATLKRSDVNDVLKVATEVMENWDAGLLAKKGVSGPYSYNSSTDEVVSITIEVSYFENNSAYSTYSDKLDKIIEKVNDGWTDWEKALYVHDYIATYFDYDYKNLNNNGNEEKYTAYGMLKTGEGVCDGYASLYSMALHRLGMSVTKVTSEAQHHGWNMVSVEGNWYYVDVTHDDAYDGDFPGKVRHNSFLRSYTGFHDYTDPSMPPFSTADPNEASSHPYDDDKTLWGLETKDMISTEDNYSGSTIWFKNKSNLGLAVDAYYAWTARWFKVVYSTNPVVDLRIVLLDSNSYSDMPTDPLKTIDLGTVRWDYCDGTNRFSTEAYTVFAEEDGIVYFNTDRTIYALVNTEIDNPYAYNTVEVYTLTEEELNSYRIYGIDIDNGYLNYYLASTPNAITENGYPIKTTVTKSLGKASDYRNSILADSGILSGYKAVLEGTSAVLSDTVCFNMQMDIGAKEGYGSLRDEANDPSTNDNTYLEVSLTDSVKGEVTYTIPYTDGVPVEGEDGVYTFSIDIPFSKLENTITITPYCHNAHYFSYEFSPMAYLDSVVAQDPGYTELVNSTKTLSAYANKYFDDDGSQIAAAQNVSSQALPSTADYKMSTSGTAPAGLKYQGSTLLLTGSIKVRNYFTSYTPLDENAFSVNNGLTCKVVCKDSDKNLYYVEVRGITAKNLGTRYTLTNGGYSFEYSAMCCASSVANSAGTTTYSTDFKNLMKALYCYWDAAKSLNV